MVRIKEAMKNEEFMKMLVEYANELEDPENKKVVGWFFFIDCSFWLNLLYLFEGSLTKLQILNEINNWFP